jgi:alpha-1,3-glucosyltransferase
MLLQSTERGDAPSIKTHLKTMTPPKTTTSTSVSRTSLNIFVFGLAVLVRTLIGFHPHSGEGDDHRTDTNITVAAAAAAYGGDLEAQRHWMELTLHLPLEQWYTYDVNYWGLDYPPLTAYVSYLCGYFSEIFLGPIPTALLTSRGYEDPNHKAFLRATVLILDIIVYFTSIYALTSKLYPYNNNSNSNNTQYYYQTLTLALLQPAIVLIDHGHFQYNTVALGLALWSFYYLAQESNNNNNKHSSYIAASIFFCLSLNFKQISLYYAPIVFAFLLGRCFQRKNVLLFLQLATTVLLTFTLLWAPFYYFTTATTTNNKAQYLLHIIHRIFPFHRGLYENKVANLWCALSTKPFSIRKRIPLKVQPILSTFVTLSMILPPCVLLFMVGKNNTKQQQTTKLLITCILWGSTACALAFFLAGFQVHEKSILFPLAPVSLLMMKNPMFILWFSMVSVWTLYPLVILDKLQLAYFSYCIFFYVIAQRLLSLSPYVPTTTATTAPLLHCVHWFTRTVVIPSSVVIMMLLHLLEKIINPQSFHLPDLFPVLWSIAGCAMILWSYIYCLASLWEIYCYDYYSHNCSIATDVRMSTGITSRVTKGIGSACSTINKKKQL